MFTNYFRTAWRNLRKQPVFSIINIAGLSFGLAAFWLIALYVGDELSFDRYHTKHERLVRVVHHANWNQGSFHLVPTSALFAPTLLSEYPEVEDAVRIDLEGGGIISYADKAINAGDIIFTDKGFFNLFTHKFIAGDGSNALKDAGSIVLTRTLAEKIFGDATFAIGKTVLMGKGNPNTVTAVIEDVPANSHFRFSGVRSLPANFTSDWQNFSLYTYLLLKPGTDAAILEAKLPAFYKKHLEPVMGQGVNYKMELQPVTSIHLNSNLEYEMGPNGNMQAIYIISIVGLLVLVIASINYMNLATTRASYRVKEIGIRKVVGSGKGQLVIMFLTESVVLCVLAGGLSVLIVELVMPYFNELAAKQLGIWRFGTGTTLLTLLGFTIVTGLLSGVYPALFMSGFLTIPSLKGQIGSHTGTVVFRKALVTFQFVITITMIAGSYIIYQQLHFVQVKNLGMNKDQVLTFHIENQEIRHKVSAIKDDFLSNPLIEGVSAASNPIGNNNIGSDGYNFEEENKKNATSTGSISTTSKMVQRFMVDGDYLPTLQIQLAKGRNFDEQRKGDQTGSVLVNETLVKELGWKNPLGKRVQFKAGNDSIREVVVIGVVKDFHIYSLQHLIQPLVLLMPPADNEKDNLYVRLSEKNIPAALEYLRTSYRRFDPQANPEFHFLKENFGAQYKAEQKQGSLLLSLTILTISIACLGLFGLISFTAIHRAKEIGIRKVLGASVGSIVRLLSTDLLKLVALAFVISTPLAWVAMKYWLQDFHYRISINWWVFLIAGSLALFIALITLSVQAVRSALANPVKSIRTE
jgi:putative ABC transport system permease protein